MGPNSQYDLWMGTQLVLLIYLCVFLFIAIVISLGLFQSLRKQDAELTSAKTIDLRLEALRVLKRALLWVFGYKGEERERTPIADVDAKWIKKYRGSIFARLVPVYAVYILLLVIWTRPVFHDGQNFVPFQYNPNLPELLSLFVVYVASNVFFDYLSLRFTFEHVLKARASKRYFTFFGRDMLFAAGLFLISQVISCVLWYLKREGVEGFELGSGLFSSFAEITMWPYAFTTGQGSTEIVSTLFPGQLLITGTIFFPTVMLGMAFVMFTLFLKIADLIKRFLVSKSLDRICRVFVKIRIRAMFAPTPDGANFSHCNLAFVILFDALLFGSLVHLATTTAGKLTA